MAIQVVVSKWRNHGSETTRLVLNINCHRSSLLLCCIFLEAQLSDVDGVDSSVCTSHSRVRGDFSKCLPMVHTKIRCGEAIPVCSDKNDHTWSCGAVLPRVPILNSDLAIFVDSDYRCLPEALRH